MTVRASGPTVSMLGESGTTPSVGISPIDVDMGTGQLDARRAVNQLTPGPLANYNAVPVVGWDYDASLLHVQTNLAEHVNNGYPSLSAILPVLNGGNFNPFIAQLARCLSTKWSSRRDEGAEMA